MKAKVLFSDENRIAAEKAKFERAAEELNQINDFLITHKLDPLTEETALAFITNPPRALREVYKARIPETNEYTGLKNNKDAMLQEMQLPSIPGAENYPYADQVKGELYLFDFGEIDFKVTLNPERFEAYCNNFRFITADPKIIQAYDDFQELAELLGKINDRLHFIPLNGVHGINTEYRLGDVLALTRRGFEIQQKGFMTAVNLLRR